MNLVPDDAADRRAFMRQCFATAMDRFGLTESGVEIGSQWRLLRSLSAPVLDLDGNPRWLRVGVEYTRHIEDPDVGAFWTGIPDSRAITGVNMPVVLGSLEFDHPDREQRARADLMTRVPGRVVSAAEVLRDDPGLPDAWWQQLRLNLDAITNTPTDRFATYPRSTARVREVFGVNLAVTEYATVHGDMHWAHLTQPECAVMDWEMWGHGPAGHDAARLYLTSLLVPPVNRRVHETFGDILDSPAGLVTQVYAAANLLRRADEFPELAEPLRNYAGPLADKLAAGSR